MSYKNTLQNLHTHSTYDDGADTLEELTLTAIEKGFGGLGFSVHGYNVHNNSGNTSLAQEREEVYKAEIRDLKEKYRGKIDLFCGVELEGQSPINLSGYDFVIGSVHYLNVEGTIVPMDRSAEVIRGVIDQHFGGDGMEYAKCYFENQKKLLEYDQVDIVGHFDLLTKHCESHNFFDMESLEYKKAIVDALDALTCKFHLFEINTGAIARGYRTTPYPSPYILKELCRRNCGIVVNSDCHDRRYLDCYFKESEELLKACGFREKYILTKEGFQAVPLKP